MGVNWAVGLIRWSPHVDGDGRTYPLHHLHPFRMTYELEAKGKHPARSVELHVAFSLHTFTGPIRADCDPADDYRDNRECRAFDRDRYELSLALPGISRSLDQRPCEFVHSKSGRLNFVTVDLANGVRYGVFFDLKRWPEKGRNAILLVVESAYALDLGKAHPGKGRIGFNSLLGLTLQGRRPRPPP